MIINNPPKDNRPNHPYENLKWDDAKAEMNFFKLFFVAKYKILTRVNDFSWRMFWQRFFDKIIYVDWDLLAKNDMRKKLDDYFMKKNKDLGQYISNNRIPNNYSN